jgi:hypothetical protein
MIQPLISALIEPVPPQKVAKGRGGRSKAAGHTHPLRRKLADHLAQGRVLATDLVYIGHAQAFKWQNVGARIHEISREWTGNAGVLNCSASWRRIVHCSTKSGMN